MRTEYKLQVWDSHTGNVNDWCTHEGDSCLNTALSRLTNWLNNHYPNHEDIPSKYYITVRACAVVDGEFMDEEGFDLIKLSGARLKKLYKSGVFVI
jgi:hypothetical protein